MPVSKKQRVSDSAPLDSEQEIVRVLEAAIDTHHSAEIAVLHLMDQHKIDWRNLQRHIEGRRLSISLSKVTWDQIGPLVGVDPTYKLARVPKFDLQRARIPGALFKSIVEDVNRHHTVYGPLREHNNGEAHSRFISPIFIRVVGLFCSSITGHPETLFRGRTATRGRVEHLFCTVGGISLLLMEIKYRTGTPSERLDAIAQVLAEAYACDYRNAGQSHDHPIDCVLFDGESFLFLKFDRKQNPKFSLGTLDSQDRVVLTDSEIDPRQFIQDVRVVCEILFTLLLQAHATVWRAVCRNPGDWRLRLATGN